MSEKTGERDKVACSVCGFLAEPEALAGDWCGGYGACVDHLKDMLAAASTEAAYQGRLAKEFMKQMQFSEAHRLKGLRQLERLKEALQYVANQEGYFYHTAPGRPPLLKPEHQNIRLFVEMLFSTVNTALEDVKQIEKEETI